MQYVCLVYGQESDLHALSPQAGARLDAESLAYDRELDRAGKLVIAQALQSIRTARTVRRRGGRTMVSDGPFAETKEQLLGFVMVEAVDLDSALEIAAGIPLAAIGTVEWVGDEGLMDAVTAVSGSGPAYVFLLAEALAQAGIAAGLPQDLAVRLARETVTGSGELLHQSPLDAATLRQNVTSPGGTTAAALAVLMGQGGLARLMNRAVAAATARSRELAG